MDSCEIELAYLLVLNLLMLWLSLLKDDFARCAYAKCSRDSYSITLYQPTQLTKGKQFKLGNEIKDAFFGVFIS